MLLKTGKSQEACKITTVAPTVSSKTHTPTLDWTCDTTSRSATHAQAQVASASTTRPLGVSSRPAVTTPKTCQLSAARMWARPSMSGSMTRSLRRSTHSSVTTSTKSTTSSSTDQEALVFHRRLSSAVSHSTDLKTFRWYQSDFKQTLLTKEKIYFHLNQLCLILFKK